MQLENAVVTVVVHEGWIHLKMKGDTGEVTWAEISTADTTALNSSKDEIGRMILGG
jgi:hypothetical protein